MEMMRDPYLQPNTEVLRNKFGVMDNEKLNTIEAEYTSTRLKEIVENPIKGNFDFDHLYRMHYNVFQDLYDLAGQPRIITGSHALLILSFGSCPGRVTGPRALTGTAPRASSRYPVSYTHLTLPTKA